MKKFQFKNIDLKSVVKEYSMITFGLILVAIGIEYFYSPNNLAAGGVSGLGIVINHFVPFLIKFEQLFLKKLRNRWI